MLPLRDERTARTAERVPFWIRLILLLDLVAVATLLWSSLDSTYEVWSERTWSVAIALPLILVNVLAWIRPRPAVRGGAAVCAFMLAAAAFTYSVLIWGDVANLRISLWLFAIANILVVIWAARKSWRDPEDAAESRATFDLVLRVPAIALALAAFAGGWLDIRAARSEDQAEAALLHDVVEIQRCAIAWAASHPDGEYPESLDALRPGSGSACLASAGRRDDESTLRYEPVSDGGHTVGFTVHARREDRRAPFIVLGDESGLVRHWKYERSAHPWQELSDGVPAALGYVRDCVEQTWAASGSAPVTSAALVEVAIALGEAGPCDDLYRLRSTLDTTLATNDAFRLTYRRTADTYELEARPEAWGETALRSYLMLEDNSIFVTLEDRAATTDDRRLPDCLPHDIGDCVHTPASDPPRVAFLHDSIADPERVIRMRVRVEGDHTRIPSGITWYFQCGATPEDTTPPEPRYLRRELAENTCWPRSGEGDVPEDWTIVRVWLRNGAGMIVRQEDTIPIVAR